MGDPNNFPEKIASKLRRKLGALRRKFVGSSLTRLEVHEPIVVETRAKPRTYNLDDFVVADTKVEIQAVPKKPIVIMQMGGVASNAAATALRVLGLADPVIHVHVLADLDQRIEEAIRDLPDPSIALWGYVRAKTIRSWMDTADESTVWNVITIIRDPIARDMSGFINNAQEYVPDIYERIERGDVVIHELQDLYLSIPVCSKLSVYYDNYFEPVFPFHLASLPYEHGKGYVIAENPPYRLLVFRYEDLRRTWTDGVHDFLGIRNSTFPEANKTEDKAVGQLYREFKSLPFPAEYVDDMYDDEVVRRFYSAEELARLRKRYITGGA